MLSVVVSPVVKLKMERKPYNKCSQRTRKLAAAASVRFETKLLRILLTLLIFLSNAVYCCEQEVPIEVKWEFNKKPTETEVGYLMILAPLKHDGWSLSGVQFY